MGKSTINSGKLLRLRPENWTAIFLSCVLNLQDEGGLRRLLVETTGHAGHVAQHPALPCRWEVSAAQACRNGRPPRCARCKLRQSPKAKVSEDFRFHCFLGCGSQKVMRSNRICAK